MEKPSGKQNGKTLVYDRVFGRRKSSVAGERSRFCRID